MVTMSTSDPHQTGAYALLRQQAEDILFTQCDGCTACQQRAKADALDPDYPRGGAA